MFHRVGHEKIQAQGVHLVHVALNIQNLSARPLGDMHANTYPGMSSQDGIDSWEQSSPVRPTGQSHLYFRVVCNQSFAGVQCSYYNVGHHKNRNSGNSDRVGALPTLYTRE